VFFLAICYKPLDFLTVSCPLALQSHPRRSSSPLDMSLPSNSQQGEVREPGVPDPAHAPENWNDAREAVASSTSTEAASDGPNAPNGLVSNGNGNGNDKSNIDSIDDAGAPRQKVYHTGWRLHALTAG
jgi:hypothetical protein